MSFCAFIRYQFPIKSFSLAIIKNYCDGSLKNDRWYCDGVTLLCPSFRDPQSEKKLTGGANWMPQVAPTSWGTPGAPMVRPARLATG